MTLAELERLIASKKRMQRLEAKERASADYILADLIGRSVSRAFNSNNTMPEISTVYPTLFDSKEVEEQKAIKKAELSALRFKQFANAFNRKFKEVQTKDE